MAGAGSSRHEEQGMARKAERRAGATRPSSAEEAMGKNTNEDARAAGFIELGGELRVHRLGFGAMRITGQGVWGPPKDRDEALRVLRRSVELGVDLIDTADSYGPEVS